MMAARIGWEGRRCAPPPADQELDRRLVAEGGRPALAEALSPFLSTRNQFAGEAPELPYFVASGRRL
jgi:hypothetical protein